MLSVFFADGGQYEDVSGAVFAGTDDIRAAFEPLICGARGRIRFDGEDYFAEPATGKVMVSWTLTMEIEGQPMKMRGLDLLQFQGNKLVRKQAYCKSSAPQLDPV